MSKEDDPVKYWAGVRQCISDINKATASLQLALACGGNPAEFVTVTLTKRQIAMLLVLLEGALD
jgi:alanine-alpha-ketoisovalerate/valine-pyruvate aminotransferase